MVNELHQALKQPVLRLTRHERTRPGWLIEQFDSQLAACIIDNYSRTIPVTANGLVESRNPVFGGLSSQFGYQKIQKLSVHPITTAITASRAGSRSTDWV